MLTGLESVTSEAKKPLLNLQKEISRIINDDLIGVYLHGSLALGGFNPDASDIDAIAVTRSTLTTETKEKLARTFLRTSNSPFPLEIHFLNARQLTQWQHPCPFDFHFSEFWREQYTDDLLTGTKDFLNGIAADADLAAHITILNHSGICLTGKPINEVFPSVPQSDYLSAIMNDYRDCLENIHAEPVYSTLNLIRVLRYLKDGKIASKAEAGSWGLSALPEDLRLTLKKVTTCYATNDAAHRFGKQELERMKNYLSDRVRALQERFPDERKKMPPRN
ncbi:aminoglycoside adenylyltransferase domain-containing protein [Edaphobacillus lindanitolerans]|uniref:Spectinomycin 9-adenylyltransferase n=1 Tax=Edaphobacillus lindanitolerans TaxID=550447 RepID=A0A1U7PR85_9BACI|nr:aminoglycoside adenylyltransferase domain-containing protein [Edaphobacillus lindanitolerans]SIT91958.1 streptomycin 3-adenylyltransferase [Edaphobacillus lindanitolerans]